MESLKQLDRDRGRKRNKLKKAHYHKYLFLLWEAAAKRLRSVNLQKNIKIHLLANCCMMLIKQTETFIVILFKR